MADPVLERDLQQMADLEAAVGHGDREAERLLTMMTCKVASQMTKWQWVIHGDTLAFRKVIVRWLCNKGDFKLARRFALCGRGDVGFNEYAGENVKIVPMGCGCRFCPRCSRRFGRRFLSKVGAHLEKSAHGPIWHVVLTQRVQRSETLIEARERFGKAWKRFYPKLRKLGMSSALCTYHVTASLNGGWHYHCHLVVEWRVDIDTSTMAGELTKQWHWAKADSGDRQTEVFARLVCEAGGPIGVKSLAGQGELWSEAVDPVLAALQYVVRDVLQGVEKWVAKITNLEDASSFADALTSAKLHRLYGVWRTQISKKKTEEVSEEESKEGGTEKGGSSQKDSKAWSLIGRMDEVLWRAKQGETAARQCVQRLLIRFSNKGLVSKRLRKLARSFCV